MSLFFKKHLNHINILIVILIIIINPNKIFAEQFKYFNFVKYFVQIDLCKSAWYISPGKNYQDDVVNNFTPVKEFPIHVNKEIKNNNSIGAATLVTYFSVSEEMKQKLVSPIIFFPHIGENWIIYLNGTQIQNEMHLDNTQTKIIKYRSIEGFELPFNNNLLKPGKNELRIIIVGNPPNFIFDYNDSFGLNYRRGYIITNYNLIKWVTADLIPLSLNGIFVIFSFFFLILFLYKQENIYLIFISIFSFFLAIKSLSETFYIYQFIENTIYIDRLNYFITYLIVPLIFLFWHFFNKTNQKIKISYLLIILVNLIFSLVIIILPARLIQSIHHTWQIITIPVLIFFVVELIKSHISVKRMDVRFVIYSIFSVICGAWDFIDALFFQTGIRLLYFAFLLILVKLTITSIREFYSLLDKSLKLNIELVEQKNAFYRFVPINFLNLLGKKNAQDIHLGDSSEKKMTVMFTDIRAFTTISEALLPSENFAFLNGFLKRMEPIIRENRGFVDKYIGDAILALFNDDKGIDNEFSSADRALVSAISMQSELCRYNIEREKIGLDKIAFGIGLHTGKLILGTVGSEQRLDTTVIGNTVNLASRLENLTKYYKTPIIISDQTYRDLDRNKHFLIREIDSVFVKGKTIPVTIHEVYELEEEEQKDLKSKYNDLFQSGIKKYKTRNFEDAIEIFNKIFEKNPKDQLAYLYINRCKRYIKNPPPENWEGVVMLDAL